MILEITLNLHNDNDDTLLSRTGETTPGGKLDRRLDIPVSEKLEAAIISLASMHGMPKSEFARRLLDRVVFGELPMMQRIFAQSTNTLGGNDGSNAR